MPDKVDLQVLPEKIALQRPRILKRCGKHLASSGFRGDITDAAEDVAQNVMRVAIKKIGQYRHEGPLEAWLNRIAFRETINFLRNAKIAPALFGDIIAQSSEDLKPSEESFLVDLTLPDVFDDYLDLEQIRIAVNRYREILAGDPHYFEAFSLVVILGYSYQDAAQILGDPIGTVKSRISRSWTKIRNYGKFTGKKSHFPN